MESIAKLEKSAGESYARQLSSLLACVDGDVTYCTACGCGDVMSRSIRVAAVQ